MNDNTLFAIGLVAVCSMFAVMAWSIDDDCPTCEAAADSAEIQPE